MTVQNNKPAAIRVVIPFVFRHWLNQPVVSATVISGFLGATVADLFMPMFSGHLVDALTSGAATAVAGAAFARGVMWTSVTSPTCANPNAAKAKVAIIKLRTGIGLQLEIMEQNACDAVARSSPRETNTEGPLMRGIGQPLLFADSTIGPKPDFFRVCKLLLMIKMSCSGRLVICINRAEVRQHPSVLLIKSTHP